MTSSSDQKLAAALLALVVAGAGAALFQPPSVARNLEYSPDTVEYATMGVRLATHGTSDIVINGVSYPSRYPPWFSLLVLAPAYKLLGPEPGNGILPVFLFGVAGVAAAFLLGRRISGNAGGWLAALFVLLLPDYRLYGKMILTDIPATAVVLILALLFVRLRDSGPSFPRGLVVLSALLVGLAAALRPATASVVLPFLLLAARSGRRGPWLGALFVLPLAALVLLQAAHDACAFGDPFRNGYEFWCPVPYDYFHMTFGLAYLKSNAVSLLASGAVYVAVVLALLHLLARRTSAAGFAGGAYRSLGLFVALGLGPLLLFHMVYFCPVSRFFLPLAACLAAMAGGVGGRMLNRAPLRTLVLIQAGLVLLVGSYRWTREPEKPKRAWAAETIRDDTPADSVVITGVDPAYLALMLGDSSQRLIVPVSRRVEYASKLVCYERIPELDPPPTAWWDHRCPGLARGGAVDVIPATADEDVEWIAKAMEDGRPVFMHTMVLPQDIPIVNSLGARFVPTLAGPWLYRLTLPPEK